MFTTEGIEHRGLKASPWDKQVVVTHPPMTARSHFHLQEKVESGPPVKGDTKWPFQRELEPPERQLPWVPPRSTEKTKGRSGVALGAERPGSDKFQEKVGHRAKVSAKTSIKAS